MLRGSRRAGAVPVAAFVGALLGSACNSSSSFSSTTQSPSSLPVNSVNIAGTWSGTLESSNLPTQTISLIVVQTGNCVDGAWQSADSSWRGAISGIATADAYTGQISLERLDDGGTCSAVATVSGPVDGQTLRWSGTSFTMSRSCDRALPVGFTLSLRRQ